MTWKHGDRAWWKTGGREIPVTVESYKEGAANARVRVGWDSTAKRWITMSASKGSLRPREL